MTWFANHLSTLRNDPRVSVRIYVTRSSTANLVAAKSPTASSSHSSSTFPDPEKTSIPRLSIPPASPILDKEIILPVSPDTPTCTHSIDLSDEIPVLYQRPDIASLVRTSIEETPKDKSVLVMSCGPERLMSVVRNTTAACIRSEGPSVELHCEQFGW